MFFSRSFSGSWARMSGGSAIGLVGWLVNSEKDLTSKVKSLGVRATQSSEFSGLGIP